MITDRGAYERLRVASERRALRERTVEESIALGEALLTSAIARPRRAPATPRPVSLARLLGVPPERLAASRPRR